MENKPRHDPNPDSNRPEEPELDLYTIPSYSSWFAWNDIHETERQALKEFFEGSSISRTPKIYKEYRDFIINKYREDPSRRLTFTEIRKSLIGDVTLLHKVFRFLETWGLINFLAPPPPHEGSENDDRVRVENGAPNGVRVVATPNSLRPLSAPVVKGKNSGDGVDERGVKLPPLASYSDVFGDLKRLHCGSCGDNCHSGYYEYKKDNFIVCDKCFKNGNYGEDKSMDDFELKDCREKSAANGTVWTEAETLLLLDSVLKHGDDWDLVAQNVQTKSKLDCITKLIELPFGESLIDSAKGRGNSSGTSMSMNGIKPVVVPSSEDQENIINEDQGYDGANENEKNGDSENQEPPLKKKRTASTSDADSSLMKQVARISTMVGPQITAAAAEAAVAMLSDEMSCPREIFYGDHIDLTNGSLSPSIYQQERAHNTEESEIKERSNPSESQETHPKKSDIPLPLRIRAAVATGLGAAAAHAKLLAVQEEKEIEHLVATIIEAQLKKLNSKIKHCEDAELLMEKEYAAIEGLKEYILGERINILRTTYNTGTSKLLEHSSVQSQTSNLS